MTNVVAFRPDRRGRTSTRPDDEPGRILLFTGIRYVRDEEPTEEATKTVRRSPVPVEVVLDGAETERLKA